MTDPERLSPPRPTDFPDEWYDLASPSHFWFRWRFEALRRALVDGGLAAGSPLRVLDVGAGAGVLSDQLEAATAWTVDRCDVDPEALRRCGPARGRVLCYDLADRDRSLLGRYHLVVVADVLEHLADPRGLLAAAVDHLAPGGALLVNVPAVPSLHGDFDRATGHLRRYTARSLALELTGLGLRQVLVRYWGLTMLPLLVARRALVRGAPADVVRRGLSPPFPLAAAALAALMTVETRLLRRPPLGTSVLYLGRLEPGQARR